MCDVPCCGLHNSLSGEKKMEAISSLLAFVVTMVILFGFATWVGFRVIPFAKNMVVIFGRGLASIVHPLFYVITIVGKLFFNLSVFLFTFMIGEAKNLAVSKPAVAKNVNRVKKNIRKDRLCQMDY